MPSVEPGRCTAKSCARPPEASRSRSSFRSETRLSVIDELTAELAKLPGIGRKTATRLTYYLLKQPAAVVERLARAIHAVSERVTPCTVCGNLTEHDPCVICADARRDPTVVCVVE